MISSLNFSENSKDIASDVNERTVTEFALQQSESDHKQAELALQELNQSLEAKVKGSIV